MLHLELKGPSDVGKLEGLRDINGLIVALKYRMTKMLAKMSSVHWVE